MTFSRDLNSGQDATFTTFHVAACRPEDLDPNPHVGPVTRQAPSKSNVKSVSEWPRAFHAAAAEAHLTASAFVSTTSSTNSKIVNPAEPPPKSRCQRRAWVMPSRTAPP